MIVDDEEADAAPQPADRPLVGRADRDRGAGGNLVLGLVDGDAVPAGALRCV